VIAALARQAASMPPDSLRRALDEVFARPEYRWAESRVVLRWLGSLWLSFIDWLSVLQRTHPAQYAVFLALAVLLLVGILVHFGYVALRIIRPTFRTGGARAPADPRLDDGRSHLARARELAAAGQYAEALAQRFLALLVQLEVRQAVKFHPAKTPAEYIGEARLDAEGRAGLSALVARLYGHLFGAVPCDATAYMEFGALSEQVGKHVAAR
jgi:hypothetical protein